MITEGVTTKMKKNHVRILSLLLAAMLALSACGGTNSSGKNDENQTTSNGGEPIKDFIDFQVQASEVRTFCLLNSEDSVNSNVLCNAYSPLLELNNKGALGPAVAKEWGTDDGGLTWTFKLRDDVTWVDVEGNEKAKCTAQDWLTAMEFILNYHKNGSMNTSMPIAMLSGAEEYYEAPKAMDEASALALTVHDGPFLETVGIEAPDDYTLIYHCAMNAPYFETLCAAACLYPVSQAQLDEMGVDGFLAQTPETMWYSGPYRITEYIMNNTKTLTKNESYWDKDCTLFDTVTIRMLEDGNQDDLLFQTDEVHYSALSEGNLRIIYDDPNHAFHGNLLEQRPEARSRQWHFNYAKNNEDGTPDVNWNTAVANEAFRLSLYYGMDLTNWWSRYNFINPEHCENLAYTVRGLLYFSDGTDYVDRVVEKLNLPEGGRYNPELAQQYKEQAMEELSAKGVTFPVELDYYIKSGDQAASDSATILKEIVEALGTDYITVHVGTYVTSQSKEVYDAHLQSWGNAGWGADYGDPENFISQELYGYENAYYSREMSNINEATDPDLIATYQEYTALAEKASKIYDDMDARYEAYAEAEAYLVSHALTIPCYYNVPYQLTHVNDYTKIHGVYGMQNYTYKNWETSTIPYTAEDYEQFLADFNAN